MKYPWSVDFSFQENCHVYNAIWNEMKFISIYKTKKRYNPNWLLLSYSECKISKDKLEQDMMKESERDW